MPTLVASAVPGGPVERATYDALKSEFLQRLRDLLPLDGLYLPMHGAMYVEGMQDAEGDWMSAVREVVGPDCLISASYDLHGNVSQRVIDQLDAFSAFRTAPHIDREETFRRACDMLVHSLDRQVRPTIGVGSNPRVDAGRAQQHRLRAGEGPVGATAGHECEARRARRIPSGRLRLGGRAASDGQRGLHRHGRGGAARTAHARSRSTTGMPGRSSSSGCRRARCQRSFRARLKLDTKPVVVSDSGDNPTGGGTGDRADALAELLRLKVTNAVVAGIADRPATEACYKAGAGQTVPLTVGASLDPSRSRPIEVTGKVVFLATTERPPERQAVVDVNGISVVLTARRRPFHRPEDFTSLGLEPKSFKIVVVKAGYLVPEIAAFANPNLMALTDGAVNQDIARLSNTRRVPTFPFVQDVEFTPTTRVGARAVRK